MHLDISNNKLLNLVDDIRANRNEVIHGRDYNPKYGPLYMSIPFSISKFEELLGLLRKSNIIS
jgi:hypothetical protein